MSVMAVCRSSTACAISAAEALSPMSATVWAAWMASPNRFFRACCSSVSWSAFAAAICSSRALAFIMEAVRLISSSSAISTLESVSITSLKLR